MVARKTQEAALWLKTFIDSSKWKRCVSSSCQVRWIFLAGALQGKWASRLKDYRVGAETVYMGSFLYLVSLLRSFVEGCRPLLGS